MIIVNGVKKACYTCYWFQYGAVPACFPGRCQQYSNWKPTKEKQKQEVKES